ncbi:MAG: SagB family peptide dehydrogenase [Candidatus Hydrogenedentes bacterium]|nr:SagB family peptide dehydrogenase [Candidatus Hydrogenedentota bacterium]
MDEYKEIIKYYHERTKHKPNKFARSPGYLDWSNEPKPFRRYIGTEKINLPLSNPEDSPTFYKSLFQLEDIEPLPFDIHSISKLLLFSLGISAWKEYRGTRWALRCNPSAGNLHPTEAYIIAPPNLLGNEKTTLYHYAPFDHCLEIRATDSSNNWGKVYKQNPTNNFLILGLTTITWRMAWKYGERALRYCLLDTGHAISAITYSARAMGWKTSALISIPWEYQKTILGLNRPEFDNVEKETPQILLLIYPHNSQFEKHHSINSSIPLLDTWFGKPEKLSPQKVEWEMINYAINAMENSSAEFLNRLNKVNNDIIGAGRRSDYTKSDVLTSPQSYVLFRQRRSAHELDPEVTLPIQKLQNLLQNLKFVKTNVIEKVLNVNLPTFLVIFANSLENIRPGIYLFPFYGSLVSRTAEKNLSSIKISKEIDIFLLKEGDFKTFTSHLLCGQDVGENSAILFGLFADIQNILQVYGDFSYVVLHWEAGFIVHHLYLEAEILNLQGTGIGCFFDDEYIVEIPQPKGKAKLYPIYYYALGKPIPDLRLKSYPPYLNKGNT